MFDAGQEARTDYFRRAVRIEAAEWIPEGWGGSVSTCRPAAIFHVGVPHLTVYLQDALQIANGEETMKGAKISAIAAAVILLGVATHAGDKKLTKTQLPAAVQKTVDEQGKGARIVGFASEKEGGKLAYEAELKVGGHSKDILIDPSGKVLEVEEEVAFEKLPSRVQAALKKAAGAGTLGKVESLTKNDKLVAYEAVVKAGHKKSEVQVGPNGEKLDHEE